ncbi:hypothetical protein N7485_010053 [Penicillium canescens]|nr:hypothetical protein N7485_010053 [Penicillium canescens]
MRYSLRGRNKPAGFYNEDYEPLKPKTSAARITAKKTPVKRKAKAAKPAPKKPVPKKEKITKDLDKSDIDAQIERCRERIKAKIMPSIFETRLKGYLNRKEERDIMMNDEAEDLSWKVVQRLDDLENIRSWLEKGNDDDDQISNVKALIQAYTVGDLDWNAGLEEFLAISAKHKGHIGFWVEGGPKVGQILLKEIKPSTGTSNGSKGDQKGLLTPSSPSRVDIRLNDTVQSHPFSYVKDSGAHLITISDRNFAYLHKVSVTIEGFDPKPAASLGVTRVHLHGGEELFWSSKALQIKFRDPDHPKRGDWEWVQCHLSEEKVMGSDRIPDSGNCVPYRDSLLWKYGPREGINRKPQGVV